ncbi:MAG: 4Fe-4S binding protein [Verrucomicrobia bacterium]|nr:4Fe-4S binding protein [Verrucomicrobiota bacterium]
MKPDPRIPTPNAPGGAVHDVDWQDFRDHLATADAAGRRLWIFAKQPSGCYYTARCWVSYLLLAILFVGPFVRIQGNPLLLVNVVERKFAVFGQVFWPQDGAVLALTLLLFLTGIAVFTAAFGRLWCGWTCPQTVLMELRLPPARVLDRRRCRRPARPRRRPLDRRQARQEGR